MPSILFRMKVAHALLTVALVSALFYAVWRAQPPRHVRIAAGPVGGSFYESGQRYKALMEERGYRVTVVPLQDTDEIGAKLDDARERFDIGFVAEDRKSRGEEKWISLGDIQLQSIFIFETSRSAAGKPIHSFADLRGMSVAMPPLHSLTSRTFLHIFAAFGIGASDMKISFVPMNEEIARLKRGEFDVGLFILGADNALMADLAKDPGLVMVEIGQRDAIARKLPYLKEAVLPAGIYDLGRNIPSRDMGVLALTISVAARPGLPPATIYAALAAMREVHHGNDFLSAAGAFPHASGAAGEVDERVDAFYRSGEPWVFAHLPLALACVVDAYLAPLVALLFLTNAFKVISELQQIRLFFKVVAARTTLWWAKRRLRNGRCASAQLRRVLKSLASSIEREDGTVRDLLGELRRLSHAAHAAEAPPSSHGANSL
jgi:TRAP-type uncharacterized transport system substrate-binding protein